jgi:hypothetical protein
MFLAQAVDSASVHFLTRSNILNRRNSLHLSLPCPCVYVPQLITHQFLSSMSTMPEEEEQKQDACQVLEGIFGTHPIQPTTITPKSSPSQQPFPNHPTSHQQTPSSSSNQPLLHPKPLHHSSPLNQKDQANLQKMCLKWVTAAPSTP